MADVSNYLEKIDQMASNSPICQLMVIIVRVFSILSFFLAHLMRINVEASNKLWMCWVVISELVMSMCYLCSSRLCCCNMNIKI